MKKNLWIKVASVVLALAMWLFVISRGQTEVSMEVPLVLENVPVGLRITESMTQTVVLSIRGHERFVESLRPEDVRVSLDMSGLRKGRNRFVLDHDNVDLPAPLMVLSIVPSSVSINAGEE